MTSCESPATAREIALRAVLPDTRRTLSAGERLLLDEWLGRLAESKE